MVGLFNHEAGERGIKWEQKQVERIYNLLSNNEGGLTYAELVKSISTKYERTLYLTGVIEINGEKVRLCMVIDITKNHLDKNLQRQSSTSISYGKGGLVFRGSFETILRTGHWDTTYYETWHPNRTMNTVPFLIQNKSVYTDRGLIKFK